MPDPDWKFYLYNKPDESTPCRHLKSPRSLSGRSLHLTLFTKLSRSWSWMVYSHPLCSMFIGPPMLRYRYPWSRPCVWSKSHTTIPQIRLFQILTLKLQVQGHGWGQRTRAYTQLSIWLICFLFGWHQSDNKSWYSAFLNLTLKNQRSRSWVRSKSRSHSSPSIQPMHLLFVSHQSDQPFLRYVQ